MLRSCWRIISNGFLAICCSIVLAAMIGCGALNEPEPPIPANWTFVPHGVMRKADKVVTGTITKVEANWEYDDPCGVLANLLHKCDGTRAYDVMIKRDVGGDEYAMIFVPHNDFVPLAPGLRATFLLTKLWVLPYQKCRQVAPTYSSDAACATMGQAADVIVSTDDIVPAL